MNFLGLLVEKGLLSKSDRVLVEEDLTNKKHSLADALTARGVSLTQALASIGEVYGLPSRILGDPPANKEAFGYIPIDSARHYGFVPLDIVDGALDIGITDPDNIEAFDALQFISGKIGMPYKITLITQEDFDRVLDAYQDLSGEVEKALSEYEMVAKPSEVEFSSDEKTPILNEESAALSGRNEALQEDAPVTKIVSTVLRYAIEGHASDIHIEPSPTKTRVRFRVDGELHTSLELPERVHEAVIARIKILSKLRLDEKRKPQDGRFSATVEGHRIDFRVSTFPTEYGEKVEMRILDQSGTRITLESLGFGSTHLADIREMMKSPYGIILIAGPTGSGKSTTLFAMLSELDREVVNVVSLEDPVEYEILGVSQSQVRPEIGYTFASGLRSILRQDPDIIMVGEIRDKETAVLAVQAALTGHLVLSTIHTNTAVGAIPRLIDMGVDPFLIGPTLISVIGQRLVRKICPGAGKPFPITDSIKTLIEKDFADLPEAYRKTLPPFKEFYHATPTDDCPTGSRGRVGVFEILRMDKKLEQVVLKEPVDSQIYAAARSTGMLTMREDAIIKALRGDIPFEEINTLGGDLFPEGDESLSGLDLR
ncbi:type II/IV secretion system protein [Candidatus Kaiserbacteria bacterium]|nr:type II/IV secretion system protein [Candidatus Kaiserbacteria bacterium]